MGGKMDYTASGITGFHRRILALFVLLLTLSLTAGAWGGDTSSPASVSDAGLRKVVMDAYEKYKDDTTGKNADYIRALATVDPKIFGITVVTAAGRVYEAGDTGSPVSIQSVSKVFTASLLMQQRGAEFLQKKIGVNATGLPFNSITAIELHDGSAGNPFVNAGAIQSTSWVKARDSGERWSRIKANMDAYAGRELSLKEETSQ
jgi:glutaminase